MTDETKQPEANQAPPAQAAPPTQQAAPPAPEAAPPDQNVEGQPNPPMRKQVIYLEGGQIAWPPETFTTLDEVSTFLQNNVYRDWNNVVYNGIMEDLRNRATQPPPEQQEGAPAQPPAAQPPTAPPAAAPQPNLQVVPQAAPPAAPAETPAQKMARLESEMAALKAQLGS